MRDGMVFTYDSKKDKSEQLFRQRVLKVLRYFACRYGIKYWAMFGRNEHSVLTFSVNVKLPF